MGKTFGKTYWFELPVSDLEKAKIFYHTVLGWRYQKLMRADIMNYWMIEVDGQFIGGLRKVRRKEKQGDMPVIYFYVENLGVKIKAAQALGGQLEGERVDLAWNRGCFQWLRDPDQNLIGFWADA